MRRPAPIPSPVKRTNYEIHQLRTDIICLKKKKTEIESAVQAKKIQLQKTRSREAELKQTIKNCMRREKRHVAALRRIKLQLKNLQKDYRQVSESFLAERAKTEQAKLQVHKLEETVSKLREKVVKLQKAASARTKRQKRRTPNDENKPSVEQRTSTGGQDSSQTQKEDAEQDSLEICTRDSKGTFLPFVKECVLELLGCEVSTDNTSKVVQSVVKHFTNVEIPLKDLPSKQTVVNISDCTISSPKNVHGAHQRIPMLWDYERWHNTPKEENPDLYSKTTEWWGTTPWFPACGKGNW